jgi:hypothetical protein
VVSKLKEYSLEAAASPPQWGHCLWRKMSRVISESLKLAVLSRTFFNLNCSRTGYQDDRAARYYGRWWWTLSLAVTTILDAVIRRTHLLALDRTMQNNILTEKRLVSLERKVTKLSWPPSTIGCMSRYRSLSFLLQSRTEEPAPSKEVTSGPVQGRYKKRLAPRINRILPTCRIPWIPAPHLHKCFTSCFPLVLHTLQTMEAVCAYK